MCAICGTSVFVNARLPFAYKYCCVCEEFHFFMYFVKPGGSCVEAVCVNSSIPTRVGFEAQISCVCPAGCVSGSCVRFGDDVWRALRAAGVVREECGVCAHCGCECDALVSCLCARCRSGFVFGVSESAMRGVWRSVKRVRVSEGSRVWYRWCDACARFQWCECE